MLMKIDLSAAVRRQIPVLLDKMLETPMFITGRLKDEYININEFR
jgi:hypothetical protein